MMALAGRTVGRRVASVSTTGVGRRTISIRHVRQGDAAACMEPCDRVLVIRQVTGLARGMAFLLAVVPERD